MAKKLKCDQCDKTFSKPQGLAGHKRFVHKRARSGGPVRNPKRPIPRRKAKAKRAPSARKKKCPVCKKKITGAWYLRIHMKNMHGRKKQKKTADPLFHNVRRTIKGIKDALENGNLREFCPYCGKGLYRDKLVNYCIHCGRDIRAIVQVLAGSVPE